MRKKLPIVLFSISISCYILFFLIGSEVDEDGFLREPFGLLPVGSLFFSAYTYIYWVEYTNFNLFKSFLTYPSGRFKVNL